MVLVFHGQGHGFEHQLQGADAVALGGVDRIAPAAMLAALELAGHDEAVMRDVHVLVGRGVQQPPVVRMDFDGLFQQRVDFGDAIEALQTIDGDIQIAADFSTVIARIEHELSQAFVGVLEIALLERFVHLFPHFCVAGGLLGANRKRQQQSHYHAGQRRQVKPEGRFHHHSSSSASCLVNDWKLMVRFPPDRE